MAEEEADYSNLPLADRFQHKNWKVRKEGYEAATKAFEITADENDPVFEPFNSDSSLWKAAAGDSNVAAQQEGLAALCAYLKYGGVRGATRSRSHAIQPIFEKGLTSTRPAAKGNAVDAILLYIEVDKPESVLEELLPALSHKQPKVVAATLNALTQVYHNFGVKIVDPKPVLKALPKVYGHADKNVRAEGQNLTVELYRWLKEAMKPVFWDELKPVQQQDLEKLFAAVASDPAPKQERYTRVQQAQMEAAAAAPPRPTMEAEQEEYYDEGGAEEEVGAMDAFDLAEPVDAANKIPATFNDNINSTKWKERKDALDEVLAILSVPRLKEGPYDDLMRACAKSMKDANIAVVTSAANCTKKLAQGLRSAFSRYRSTIMAPMMERLKEKKQSVTDALGAAMDAVFAATSLSDNMSDIMAALVHKNPNVKGETIKFLARCLRTTRDVPSKDDQKQIADAGTKLLTESTEQMRSGGAEIMGILMKIIGERAFGPYLDGLDDIRKAKIKEFFDTAEVKAKEKPKPAPKATAPASAAGKKVVGGTKRPVGAVKKPVSAAVAVEELAPRPVPKSIAKPGLAKPGLSRPAGVLGGLKKPTGAPSASPQRRVISPMSDELEDVAPSPSKFSTARGLTKQPLNARAQPISASPQRPPSIDQSAFVALQVEVEELRLERERLLSLTEQLRQSNQKFSQQISDLQNQNALLIEDHTRDVLQIKAKETQLVRSKGECEMLRSEINSARRDADRYKREVSRLGRDSLGREKEEILRGRQQDSYDDMTGMSDTYEERFNGYSARLNSTSSRPGSSSLNRADSAASTSSRNHATRPQSTLNVMSPSEEKENFVDASTVQPAARRKISPPITSATARSPQRSTLNTSSANGTGDGGGESWKRAAEVTSQLKARIEAMKAKQQAQRPPY